MVELDADITGKNAGGAGTVVSAATVAAVSLTLVSALIA